VEMVFSFI